VARSTKTRLLDHAERLFAERGIPTTSVREIVTAARANLGAITYHFGSKDALVRAVIDRRLLPLNEERLGLLEAAEAASGGDPPALEAILHAIFAPAIRLWRENPGFMRLVGRMHAEPDATLKKCAEAAPLFRRVLRAIARAVPDLPQEEIAWRMHFLRGAMIHTWTGADRLAALSGLGQGMPDDEAIVQRLVQFGAAGLRAPLLGVRRLRAARPRATRRAT